MIAAHTGQDITHSIGMVFCHHDAPISRIKKLTDGLCDEVKAAAGRKTVNAMIMVMESFEPRGRQSRRAHQAQGTYK